MQERVNVSFPNQMCSLLVSFAAVFGMSRYAPPKETDAHIRTTFLSIVFVGSVRSVEQAYHITAMCEWGKLLSLLSVRLYNHINRRKGSLGRKSQLVSCQVITNLCCGLVVISCGFISHLIGCETINMPELFSGVHSFKGKTVKKIRATLSVE